MPGEWRRGPNVATREPPGPEPEIEHALNDESTIRLLIVSDSPDDAEHATAILRGAGYAAKTWRAANTSELAHALGRETFDIVLHMLPAANVKLSLTVKAVGARGTLTPVLAAGDGELTAGQAMQAGAADRIAPNDDEHLRLAIVREFGNVLTRRRAHHLGETYAESEQRARGLMESSRDAIAYIHAGMHVLANDAYLSRFGYKAFEDLEGLPMMDMVAENDQEKLKAFLREYSTGEEAVGTLELVLQQADGDTFQAKVEFSRASIEGEACSQIIIRDQGDTEELERQLTLLSQRDNVTGLYNRQHFMELLDRALWQAEHEERHAALIQLQLDEFASVKQKVGVLGSDKVIADIASVLQNVAGDGDSLARFDGASYAILTPRARHDDLDQYARQIRERVKDHICDIDGTSIGVTTSIGVARIDGSTTDPNDLLSRAERALSEAIDRGPDAHRIYQPKPGELSQKQIDRQWIEQIKDILKNDRLTLLYQPMVSLAGDDAERYQVQLRVTDEEGNPMDDKELMAAAGRTGMSRGLDRWVVLHSLQTLVAQVKRQPKTVFFIPLSGYAFEDTGLFRWIHERVQSLGLPAGTVVFETGAAATATRLKQASAFTKAVHKIGCQFALSEFGHGSEPFQLVRHVQVDFLRINEEFMHELQGNPQNQDALKEITAQARELGKGTICPAVSDAGTLSVVWGLGSDLIQGSFLQEPTTELNYDFSSMAL